MQAVLRELEGRGRPLASPVVAQLPEDLAPEVWNFEAELEALGFRFEAFGEGALRVTAVPGTVTDPEAALLAALYALAGGEDLAKALACKGSTRFGENLSRDEMEVLLREWSSTEFREICPHGLPIVKRLALPDYSASPGESRTVCELSSRTPRVSDLSCSSRSLTAILDRPTRLPARTDLGS